MNFYRFKDAMKMPLRILHAKLDPVSYARSIGIRMHGKVTIYGNVFIFGELAR